MTVHNRPTSFFITSHIQQPLAIIYTVRPSLNDSSLTSPAISLLLNCTIITCRPVSLEILPVLATSLPSSLYIHTQQDARRVSKAIVHLPHTHFGNRPFSPASPAFSAAECYTVRASYLILYPRFTLRAAAVTGKTVERHAGQPRGACAQASELITHALSKRTRR